MRVLIVATMMLVGCNKGDVNSQDCGVQMCPAGTGIAEYRADRQGYDLDLAVDPASYSGEVAFSTFGESECQYQCTTLEPCDEGTFPVITTECFTCGFLAPDGEVNQGSCSDL